MMPRRSAILQLASLAALPAACRTPASGPSPRIPDRTLQIIAVSSPDWSSTTGTLHRFARHDASSPWLPVGTPIPVSLGRHGLRPGRGLWSPSHLSSIPPKQEGDGCSPAGLFSLGTAFGTHPPQGPPLSWPWEQMSPHHAGVDDPASPHYNQIVDQRLTTKDWISAENMIPESGVYRSGLVVHHNADNLPSAGSCIFLHIWQQPAHPTAGCTAMSEPHLHSILHWLSPHAHPLLLQLPGPASASFQAAGIPLT